MVIKQTFKFLELVQVAVRLEIGHDHARSKARIHFIMARKEKQVENNVK